MAENSKVEWCRHTANTSWGCAEVHAGCDNCYARVLSHRWGHNLWGNKSPRRAIKSVWKDLMKFQQIAKAAGEIHSVFVGSMMDIFEKPMPCIDAKGNKLYVGLATNGKEIYNNISIDKHISSDRLTTGHLRDILFYQFVPKCPNLLFLLLTKRPSNINKYIPDEWKINPPANVMFGTSPVNQETADKLIPQLLAVKGKHFLSCEPMLGSIDLTKFIVPTPDATQILGASPSGADYEVMDELRENKELHQIDWVIVGGESGGHKRPFNTDWGRQIREDCKKHNIPFFMKQIDKIQPIPDDLMIREFPKTYTL